MTPLPSAAVQLALDSATLRETLAVIQDAQYHEPDSPEARQQTRREAAVELITALGPRNAVEAAYAARAAAAHYGVMECFRRAALPDTPDSAALRWQGKAIALSRMSIQMLRELEQCRKAAPPAEPQPLPAAPPRPAPAVAQKPVGRKDPMPSERLSPAPGASAMPSLPGRTAHAGTSQPAVPPDQVRRAALLASTSQTGGGVAAFGMQARPHAQ
jgi:hypothetical protein